MTVNNMYLSNHNSISISSGINVKHLFSLVWMNLIVTKRYLIFAAAYSLVLPHIFGEFALSMISTSAAAVYMILLSLLAYEDKYQVDRMTGIMPVGRKAIIISKFLTALIVQLFAFIFGIAAKYITETILAWYRNDLLPVKFQLPDFSIISVCILISALCVSLYLPLYYIFGYQRLRLVSLVLFLALFFGGQMLSNMAVSSSFSGFITRISANEISFIVVIISIILVIISYIISYKIYKIRDL